MIRALAIALAALAASPAAAFERLGVIAVADPPSGPDADLAELTHQIRAACRDRIGGIEDVPTMRARLLGQSSNATLSELDRAYGGALAVFQNGEFESALRTLHAIVEDLESLPETDDSYSQWVRAQLRLAHAALTIARDGEADAAFFALAKTDSSIMPDADQYSPSYRRRFEQNKAKVRALPARRLVVTAEGAPGTVYVNGRPMGMTPLALWLPAGTYRIGGQAADLRVPSFVVDLRPEDRSVVLDFALAESLRVNAGPGLALPLPRRGDGIVRAGAWLVVDKVVAVSRVFEGEAAFLLGSIYDVRRGSLLREGSVRMVAGSVPSANLGALAAFLLTGQSSRDVKERFDPGRAAASPVAASPPAAPVAPAASTASAPTPAAAKSPAAAEASSPAPAARALMLPPIIAPPLPAPEIPPVVETRAAPAKVAFSKPSPPPITATAPPPAAKSKPPQKATAAAAASKASAPGAPAATKADASPALASSVAAPPAATSSTPGARVPATLPGAAAPTPTPTPTPTPAPAAKPSLAAVPPSSFPPRSAAERTDDAPRRWLRPAAIGSGVVAGAFTALAFQQAHASSKAHSQADAMVGAGGALVAGSDPARYRALRNDGDAARRNSYISAGAAVAFAAAAGVLGWRSIDSRPEPALAFRF